MEADRCDAAVAALNQSCWTGHEWRMQQQDGETLPQAHLESAAVQTFTQALSREPVPAVHRPDFLLPGCPLVQVVCKCCEK